MRLGRRPGPVECACAPLCPESAAPLAAVRSFLILKRSLSSQLVLLVSHGPTALPLLRMLGLARCWFRLSFRLEMKVSFWFCFCLSQVGFQVGELQITFEPGNAPAEGNLIVKECVPVLSLAPCLPHDGPCVNVVLLVFWFAFCGRFSHELVISQRVLAELVCSRRNDSGRRILQTGLGFTPQVSLFDPTACLLSPLSGC